MRKHRLHLHIDERASFACERLASILFDDASVRAAYDVSLSVAGRRLMGDGSGRAQVCSLDSRLSSGLNGMLELAGFFRKSKPDIVHILSSGLYTLAPGAARLAGAGLVVQTFTHGERERWASSLSGRLASSLAADVLAASSEATRKKLLSASGSGKAHVSVIYADIHVPFRCHTPSQLRARMGLPSGQLLFAADLSADHGPALGRLLRAFAALRSKTFFKTMPVLALCGLPRARVDETISLLDRHGLGQDVVFYGADESAREAAATCDVFISPCAGPGDFQPAVLAAMAAGKTVVASREGIVPELLEASKSGLLVAPGDHEALYRALELVTNDSDLKVKMGYAAKNRFERYFRPGSTAQAYLGLYQGRKSGATEIA